MTDTIVAADVPARWPDILTALHAGEREFLVTKDQEVQAVIIAPAQYRRLVALALREERRQRALDLPLAAAESPAAWDGSFETLERISARFADLLNEDVDELFGAVLSEIQSAG